MSNTRYKNALNRKIELFKKDFLSFSREQFTDKNNKLIHPGEFGTSRENSCKELFKSIMRNGRDIDTKGFIMNANDEISGEQDLIFYSKTETPLLTIENEKFFPVETVVAIGQIKSVLRTKRELKDALDKLMKVKNIRENMGHTSVSSRGHNLLNGNDGYFKENGYDQIFTFLVCEKIDINITAEEIDLLYDKDTQQHLKHNIILDLSNGIYGYRVKAGNVFAGIPFSKAGNSTPSFVVSDDKNIYIQHFLNSLSIFTSEATIFYPDMAIYLKN